MGKSLFFPETKKKRVPETVAAQSKKLQVRELRDCLWQRAEV